MLSFVIAEEDLRIETSYPFNKVTAVFLFDNPCYQNTFVVAVKMVLTSTYNRQS